MTHHHTIRIYWEDTDGGGVVYYANYLKFAERARTEMLRSAGIQQSELEEKEGIFFVVRHVTLDLQKPARLDNLLTVTTELLELKGARMDMRQTIHCEDRLLARLEVGIACVNRDFKPVKVPARLGAVLTDGA